MNTILWVVQGLLAATMAAAGSFKLIKSRAALQPTLKWVAAFPAAAPKLIGGAEVLAALGLILPMVTGILPCLTPLAALALVPLMLGAFVTHLRLNDAKGSPPALILCIMAAVVAWGRWELLQ